VIAVTPTRGDRGQLLEQCKKYVERQTHKVQEHIIIDYPPTGKQKDITPRFRDGINQAISKGADIIVFMEDDDWYHPNYIKQMLAGWNSVGRPACFGIGFTYYYHIGTRAWTTMRHPQRASAFCTMLTATAINNFKWPSDSDPFLDVHLWKKIPGGRTIMPQPLIALGIKHGIGLSGGMGHNKKWRAYTNTDLSMSWLRGVVGEEDFKFYQQLANEVRNRL